ncbi:hypothetical protein ACIGXA_39515 [Streptomyces fildesensis]|uniref:Carboxypeptidase regulatory-like domain-containing protein n=1 Tax=Streptomyces fildesensis TaxID=375757 RepID=A0ABW8CJI3_9ACTN
MASNNSTPTSRSAGRRGIVCGTVRAPDGEPLANFGMFPHAVTPVEVRDILMITDSEGSYSLSLLPGVYIIRTRELADSAARVRGESAEVTVEAGRTVSIDIIVNNGS